MNLFAKKAFLYKPGSKSSEYQEVDIPPEERAAMGRRAREFVLAECTIEGDVELLTGLLRDAMAGEAPGS